MSDAQERKRLQIGGQAVIEGVMMRSPTRIATAVRGPEGIVVRDEPFTSLVRRHRMLNVPIVRGAVAFVETFVVAIKALSYSAEAATAEPGASRGKGISTLSIALTIAAAFLLGFGVFFYLPLVLTELTGLRDGVLFNLVDGVIRLAFLVLYIVLITRWKEMRRIFEYHGAEHKTIAAFEEHGVATVENTRVYPTMHARCSTSFLLLVVVVSVLVFITLGRPDTIGEKLLRFAFIPVIGGISYELLKFSARPRARRYFAPLVWPGLALQRLTTKQPSDDQVEVAIAALNACLVEKPVAS